METLEAARANNHWVLVREHAERLAHQARAGFELNLQRHPDLYNVEGLKEYGGLVLLEAFDADSYYASILPWYRSHDRAKVHVVTHFESLCGRLPQSLRANVLNAIGTGVKLRGLCAVDRAGNRWFVPVDEGEPLREVRFSAAQEEAYERARAKGGLSELPTLA